MKLNHKGISIIEVMGGLAIICMISLASAAISMQVVKTSKKSKTIALGIALESALLEALANPEQPGFVAPNGAGVKERLRGGNPPSEIQLWSNFSSNGSTEISSRTLLYRLRLAPATPEDVYINSQAQVVSESQPWVLRLRATYREEPGAAAIPQYSIAYSISGNSVDASFRSFGSSDSEFDDEDYVFPISQAVYTEFTPMGVLEPGKCQVEDFSDIVSLYSVNMETSETRCVTKGVRCGAWELSTGIDLTVPENGNLSLDLNCLPIRKCSCKHIAEKNWVITSFTPINLVNEASETCGICEFAFRKNVPAEGVPTSQGNGEIASGICPSQNYATVNIQCESEVVEPEFIGLLPASASEPNPCEGISPPTGFRETFAGLDAGQGRARCSRPGYDTDVAGCYRWRYDVRITGAQCNLTGTTSGPGGTTISLTEPQLAKPVDRGTP